MALPLICCKVDRAGLGVMRVGIVALPSSLASSTQENRPYTSPEQHREGGASEPVPVAMCAELSLPLFGHKVT